MLGWHGPSGFSHVSNKAVYWSDLCLLKANEKAGFVWFSIVVLLHWPLVIG